MKLHKEWQDYSIDINTEGNHGSGVRAIIQNHNNGSVTAVGGL